MSIKVDMTSPDVDKQLELLKFYPEIVVKHYKPALKRIVTTLSRVILPLIPHGVSGRARDTFGSRVTGTQLSTIKGQVGWYDKDDPRYVRILEAGAKEHPIEPRGNRISLARYREGKGSTKILRWMDSGEFVFAQSVNHPGFSKVGMLAAGMSASNAIVENELKQASEAVVNEMAVK